MIYENKNNNLSFYIADFYCAEHYLVVKLDGNIHENQKEYGKQRDLRINEMGTKVLRIRNEELKDIEAIKRKV